MSFATLEASRRRLDADPAQGRAVAVGSTANGGRDCPGEVTVGIRPEHAHLWSGTRACVGPIAGRATFVEMLGRETLVGVEAGGEQFAVLADADARVVPGDGVSFGVEPRKLYLFDPSTSRSIAIV